ncbi:helix-turn-helix domain-containing protein [Cupriavidus pauculus]|uniref:XRE family transcriptional regulator n=1 Tax=Cupriavidus pauculus TaxID=82633 RepID=A0A2N5CDU2_9BURK|nr:helix-turn-helix domain-containing protein [Cupriavidus pauculus]PLQ00374.1 XRE family transcriptional regulator [Cupriavidus pauculus]
MDLIELGVAFKAARIHSRKTQQEVADLTGVSRARISAFENGALPELGVVKVLALFEVVGLEILARPAGQGRTLDDLVAEQTSAAHSSNLEPTGKRVRHIKGVQGKRAGAIAWLAGTSASGKGGPTK